jgi:GNAT superfamily N-acetyltransferase
VGEGADEALMAEPLLSAPELLNAGHDVSQFSCGKPSLDHWLKTRALANQQKGFTVVMVVHVEGRVVGYYGLAPTAIVPASLPRAIRTGQPPNPVPCILLGQLATDRAWGGQGIGLGLFNHALARSVNGAALIGGRALIVNAIDDDAAAFWRRRGFLPSKDDALVLFRPIADIAASLGAVGDNAGR